MTTNDSDWQWMTTSNNEWQRMATSGTTNDNKWHNEWKQIKVNESDFRFHNETIMQCITKAYTETSFWK